MNHTSQLRDPFAPSVGSADRATAGVRPVSRPRRACFGGPSPNRSPEPSHRLLHPRAQWPPNWPNTAMLVVLETNIASIYRQCYARGAHFQTTRSFGRANLHMVTASPTPNALATFFPKFSLSRYSGTHFIYALIPLSNVLVAATLIERPAASPFLVDYSERLTSVRPFRRPCSRLHRIHVCCVKLPLQAQGVIPLTLR